MIAINSLTKHYSKNEIGVNNLSFELPNKGLTIIVGESGSGKTTLLNLLSGLIRPTDGSIAIDDIDITKLSDRKMAKYRGQNIGFVFQDYKLIERWTVCKNILYASELAGIKITMKEIEDICVSLELIDENGFPLLKKKVADLSGGQKQRVAIARAIIKKPKILLCDEPTGSLDEENSLQIMSKLRTVSHDTQVVVVTHNESLIDKNDYLLRLKNGEIIETLNVPKIENTTYGSVVTGGKMSHLLAAIKTAWDCLLSKKATAIFSALLTGLSLFVFSLPFIGKSATRNYQNIQIDTLLNYKQPYVVLGSDNIMVSYDDDRYNYHYGGFSDKQVEKIEEYNDFSFVSYEYGTRLTGETASRKNYFPINAYEQKCLHTFSGEIHFKDASSIKKFGYILDERVTIDSHLPNTVNEFAITDFQADVLLEYGIAEWNKETRESFNRVSFTSINELIGFEMNGCTICGVVKSPVSKERFIEVGKASNSDAENSRIAIEYHFLSETVWIAGENETRSNDTFLRLDKGASTLKELLKNLPFEDYDHLNSKHKHNVLLVTPFDESIDLAIGVLDLEITHNILFIVSGVFGLLVFVLLLFALNAIYKLKKKELGIICCLGASKTFNIVACLIQALIIALSGAFIAILVSTVFISIINSRWGVAASALMPLDVLLLLLIPVVVAFIASIPSLIKISKSEVVDLVKEQE